MKNLVVSALMLGGLFAAMPITSIAQSKVAPACSVTRFCESTRGSTGWNVILRYSGTPDISMNNFWVMAQNAPVGEFGGFILGDQRLYRPFKGSMMCIGGAPARISPVLRVDKGGQARVDINARVLGVIPGDTRYLQFWYRDSRQPTANLNFSDALEITFCQ